MGLILKILLAGFAAALVLLGAAALYMAAALGLIDVPWISGVSSAAMAEAAVPASSAKSQPQAQPAPNQPAAPRPESTELRQLETKISRDLAESDRFEITLTEEELNRLLQAELGARARIGALMVDLMSDRAQFNGELRGRIPVPFSGSMFFRLNQGIVSLELDKVKVGVIPLSGFAKDGVNAILNEIGSLNDMLAETGQIEVTVLELSDAAIRIAGRRSGRASAKARGAAEAAKAKPLSPEDFPKPRDKAARQPAVTPRPGAWLYLSLGDSLAAGEGASSPQKYYAFRFWRYLEETFRVSINFTNLGIAGESTNSFVRRVNPQIKQAIAEIERLRGDGIPETDVHVITLSLGANDIFPVLQSDECTNNPAGAECQRKLDEATNTLEQNMDEILSQLRRAAGPKTLIVAVTYYNPFDFGTGLSFESVAEGALNKLNARIRSVAERNQVAVADAHALFNDLAVGLTHILSGDVHPQDAGYDALLLAFEDAYEATGPFK